MNIEPMPEGTGALIARMAADDRKAASELATPVTAGPVPVVAAVATGSGWVSAGLLLQLARAWDRTANKEKHEAELCRDHTNMVGHFAIHGAYKTASQELRLLVEDASVRQPTPNSGDELRPQRK